MGNKINKSALVVISGGLDSSILLHWAISKYEKVEAVSFDFKQKMEINNNPNKIMFQNNIIEINYAIELCKRLNIKHTIVDASFMNGILKNMKEDSVRFNGDIEDHQPKTCMPFRNMTILSTVLGIAELNNNNVILTGYQTQDQHGYWDTSEEFVKRINSVAELNPTHKIEVIAPFGTLNKSDEIEIGLKLGVDFSRTWTCYNPLTKKKEDEIYDFEDFVSCGTCPSCEDRLMNFNKLGMEDPIPYWNDTRIKGESKWLKKKSI